MHQNTKETILLLLKYISSYSRWETLMIFSIKNKADIALGSVCLICLRLLGIFKMVVFVFSHSQSSKMADIHGVCRAQSTNS